MIRRLAAAFALLAACLAAAAPAQAIPVDERGAAFNRLEKKVMCIECNVPLNIAEAAQADGTRMEMRRLLDEGLSEQQVLDQLVADYGANVLASPKAEGINVLAYAVPAGVLVGLLALGVALLPRWRRSRTDAEARNRDDDDGPGGGQDGSGGAAPGGGPSRAESERLDAELARYGT